MYFIIFGICFIYICSRYTVLSKSYPECYGVEKFHTFVASKMNCARYIYCDGENSFEGECLGDNIFNEIEGNCDDPKDVVCYALNNGNMPNVNGELNGNEVNGNTNSNNAVSGFINSNIGNHDNKPFNPLPSIALPDLTPNPNGPTSISNPLPEPYFPNEFVKRPQCPQSYDQTKLIQLPNPTSCASYYTCYNGIAIPMICGRNMYFNEQSGKCEPQEQVNCALERPVRVDCLKGIYEYMPHPRNCDYYYFCSNGFLMIFQCPFKFTWHYERRTCVHQSQSKCYSTAILQKTLLAYSSFH